MPSQSLPPAEGYPTLHCATHEKPFPCPDCVAARLPSQSLPDGVQRLAFYRDIETGDGEWRELLDANAAAVPGREVIELIDLRDLPKIEEQVRQQVREQVRERLRAVLGCCQEVAHEVEDPIQALAEIEGITRKALDALDHKGDTDAH